MSAIAHSLLVSAGCIAEKNSFLRRAESYLKIITFADWPIKVVGAGFAEEKMFKADVGHYALESYN